MKTPILDAMHYDHNETREYALLLGSQEITEADRRACVALGQPAESDLPPEVMEYVTLIEKAAWHAGFIYAMGLQRECAQCGEAAP